MPASQYLQFCPVARAAEIVGERWTILIVRELFFGPQRFSDIRRRLSDVSPSVLTERLASLEQRGLVTRSDLAPPAASSVYTLTEAGQGLAPVLAALAQWGSQFLLPVRPGEQLDPDRLRLGLGLYARRAGGSTECIEFRVRGDQQVVTIHARGGPGGTTISEGGAEDAALVIEGAALDLVGVLLGTPEGRDALKQARARVLKGPRSAAGIRDIVAQLFDFNSPAATAGRAQPSP